MKACKYCGAPFGERASCCLNSPDKKHHFVHSSGTKVKKVDCSSLLFKPRGGVMMFVENSTIYFDSVHDMNIYNRYSLEEVSQLIEEGIEVVLTHETLHAVLESVIDSETCCNLHAVDAWGYPISSYPEPPFR